MSLGRRTRQQNPLALHKGPPFMFPTLSNEVSSAAYIEEELKTKFPKTRYSLFYRADTAAGRSSPAGNWTTEDIPRQCSRQPPTT